MHDYQSILDAIYEQTKSVSNRGVVASYIPELAKALSIKDTDIWKHVNVEPSGNPLNHLVGGQLIGN